MLARYQLPPYVCACPSVTNGSSVETDGRNELQVFWTCEVLLGNADIEKN